MRHELRMSKTQLYVPMSSRCIFKYFKLILQTLKVLQPFKINSIDILHHILSLKSYCTSRNNANIAEKYKSYPTDTELWNNLQFRDAESESEVGKNWNK